MILRAADPYVSDLSFDTIFIGGGTPSFVPHEYICGILELTREIFNCSDGTGLEISMEFNPDSVSLEMLDAVKDSGVNRVSLGVQALDDRDLKVLGRVHGTGEVYSAVGHVRKAGFENFNIDLIYSIPGQDHSRLASSLKKALALAPSHVSCYELSLEKGTAMERAAREGDIDYPDQETRFALTQLIEGTLRANGYEQYEISNFCRPGFECRHNVGYWTGRPYLGLGCSACSFLMGKRIRNESRLKNYLNVLSAGRLPVREWEELEREAGFREAFVMTLRMNRGVRLREFSERYRVDILEYYGWLISEMVDEGLMVFRKGRRSLALTARGRYISNYVLSYFV